MEYYSVGKRIRQLRTQQRMSQELLALNADITPAYLGQIERGEKNPTVRMVERLSDVLGLTLSEFFEDSDKNSVIDLKLMRIMNEASSFTDEEKNELLTIVRAIKRIKTGGRKKRSPAKQERE